MYVKRNLSPRFVARYVWPDLLWTSLYNLCIFALFFIVQIKWFDMPFELVSTVGIAVAFLIGFKNNQAYDRFWEGRKIWGAIVNSSRMWAAQVISLVRVREASAGVDTAAVEAMHRELIYRQIAWINALRVQLRTQKQWAVKENFLVERFIDRHRDRTSVAETIAPFVSAAELDDLSRRQNVATHLVKNQARQLEALRHEHKLIDGFDMLLLMKTVNDAYDLQGMCERIKNTPLPRQFAYFSKVFTILFCLLIPLGLIDMFEEEFMRGAEYANLFGTMYKPPSSYLLIFIVPLSVLISSVFLTWEQIGDNSEEPFEARPFDVSMTALCRTIEIDLRDMLDEANLPPATAARDHILN
ncbi:bestrophin family protein [Sphingomonas japonica]|uniref:Membrane protein n=1 Tax=Sphingomonas japonica TaxID=511662 RepID=A0ABX0U2I8_9SPHN|nr:bestrophin family ion channel [Sphingomonas japonica]NIJ23916.1 putative membrane protein [Sphingomonas japonica]